MKKKKNAFLIFLICAAIGSIIRVVYLWCYPVPVRDAFTYIEYIDLWDKFGVFPCDNTLSPLGIYLLKIPKDILSFDTCTSGIITNMVLGLCIIYLCIKISLMIFPSSLYAFCIGLLTATHPTLVHYSCQMLRENSFLFFCCLSILFLINYYKSARTYNVIFASVFAASAYLCRYEALEVCLILSLAVLLKKRANQWKRVQSFIIFFIGIAATIVMFSCFLGVPLKYYHNAITEEVLRRTFYDFELKQNRM